MAAGKGRAVRSVKVNYLARVEGEAALYLKVRGGRVEEVKLSIFEPPRFFEALLRGRHFSEAPDITARICGICPVAYQMSAVHAIERALQLTVPEPIRLLRRLFYCGEWMESHALHIYLLHAPDFLGYQDAFEMARDHRQLVERGLRLKKIGNRLVSLLGGREIHPIAARVGGFWRVPSRSELQALKPDLEWALEGSLATLRWTATLNYPDFQQDYEFVALRHAEEYPLNEGRLVSNRGLDIDPAEYEENFAEQQVKHSNALQAVLRQRGSYMVGPLARVNLNFDRLPEIALRAAGECGFQVPCLNPFRSIQARALELVFASHEALRLIDAYDPPDVPFVEASARAASGCAITEAPRGILYHRYVLAGDGKIVSARIVPPTSQNQRRMEEDLRALVPRLLDEPADRLGWLCEQAIRNYDPCISCATHFLRFELQREQ